MLREFSPLSWDFQQTFVRLHSRFGVNPFFTVSVVDDPFSGNKSVVEIRPPVLGLPEAHLYELKEEKVRILRRLGLSWGLPFDRRLLRFVFPKNWGLFILIEFLSLLDLFWKNFKAIL